MSEWDNRRNAWRFIDSMSRIIGLVEDSACIGDDNEWSASVCPDGERIEKHLGRFTSIKAAKIAVEEWWASEHGRMDGK